MPTFNRSYYLRRQQQYQREPSMWYYLGARFTRLHVLLFLCTVACTCILVTRVIEPQNMRPLTGRASLAFRRRDSHSVACNVDLAGRFDCHPDPGMNRVRCEWRGCCFRNDSEQGGTAPTCYFPTGFAGYKVAQIRDSPSGVTMTRMRRVRPSGFPEDAAEIDVEAALHSSTTARLTVTSANDLYRTEVPPVPTTREPASQMLSLFTTRLGDVVVYRTSDRQILFETDLARLVYTPRFVQLVTLVPSTSLYGLGERKGELLRDITRSHVGFNRDLLAVNESSRFFHGSHPFYIGFDKLGTSFGVYFRTSAIYEVMGHPTPALTFRSLGSQVDVFVFGGPSPGDVVSQYLDVVGRPAMPPFWALGLHAVMRRAATKHPEEEAGYDDLLNTNYHVDVAWMPVDVSRDTCEHGSYKELSYRRPALRVLHTLVPTLSSHPSRTPVCRLAVDDAEYLGLLLNNQKQEVPLQAQILSPNITSYVLDFAAPRYDMYLSKVLKLIYGRSPFDGFWLDLNEPTLGTMGPPGGCVMDGWDVVPYLPEMLLSSEAPLNRGTLCMSQQLGAGPHFVAHNAIPYQQAKAAYDVLAKLSGERPLIVSRSSYSGIGKLAGHVIHGLRPTWGDLRLSVPMLLTASLLGMPLSGAEICGEGFNVSSPGDEELCATWFSLAAFYPLLQTNKAEVFQTHTSFSEAFLIETNDMVEMRLSLRPYLYYLFHRSHVAGETVARPLFVEFPNDTEARRIDGQFLWGSALMIVPILEPKVNHWPTYVPAGVWYDFETGAALDSSRSSRGPLKVPGEYRKLRRGLHRVLLLLRGGNVVPVSATSPTRLRDGEMLDYTLLVMLDEQSQARGSIFCDDGVSLGTYETGTYGLADITFVKDTMLVSPRHAGFACGVVREVRLMGLSSEPVLRASLNDVPVTHGTRKNQTIITGVSIYLNETSMLVLHSEELDVDSTKRSLSISGSSERTPPHVQG